MFWTKEKIAKLNQKFDDYAYKNSLWFSNNKWNKNKYIVDELTKNIIDYLLWLNPQLKSNPKIIELIKKEAIEALEND